MTGAPFLDGAVRHGQGRAVPLSPAPPRGVRGARICGRPASHVDHIANRLGSRDSALKPSGSTRSWRRIRAFVLDRDGHVCQMLLDELGHVVEAPRPPTPPLGPDDPAWLRATCAEHNLQRGASSSDARPAASSSSRWAW